MILGVTAARILKRPPGAGQAFGYAEGAGTGCWIRIR
jgi:hypothetical protein